MGGRGEVARSTTGLYSGSAVSSSSPGAGGGALSGGARVREHVRVRARSSTAAHLESQPVKTYEVRTCLFSSALRGRDVDSRVFSTV